MNDQLTQQFDLNEHDDRAVFPMRDIGERRIVLIPKSQFTLDETEATYVLTLKTE